MASAASGGETQMRPVTLETNRATSRPNRRRFRPNRSSRKSAATGKVEAAGIELAQGSLRRARQTRPGTFREDPTDRARMRVPVSDPEEFIAEERDARI